MEQAWEKLAETLGGKWRPVGCVSPPCLAAIDFRGLIESGLLERRLQGDDTITPQEIDTAGTTGVDVFLRACSA